MRKKKEINDLLKKEQAIQNLILLKNTKKIVGVTITAITIKGEIDIMREEMTGKETDRIEIEGPEVERNEEIMIREEMIRMNLTKRVEAS